MSAYFALIGCKKDQEVFNIKYDRQKWKTVNRFSYDVSCLRDKDGKNTEYRETIPTILSKGRHVDSIPDLLLKHLLYVNIVGLYGIYRHDCTHEGIGWISHRMYVLRW